MKTNKCELCGKEIDEKYKFCVACNQKLKDDQKDRVFSDNAEIIKALGAINNNLFFIRTALSAILIKDHNTVIFWDKKLKTFVVDVVK